MANLEHEKLTEKIIGAAIEVHRRLGPGFIESFYENALIMELRNKELSVTQQIEVPVYYKSAEVGRHRLDLFVEETIVVELKAVKKLVDIHFSTIRSYLKAVGQRHGLLFNFATFRLDIKRVISQ